MTKHIVAFDLETTGLNVQTDHILQIGLVKFDSSTFEIIDHRCWYIKPARDFTIAPEAAEKTGFTKEFILENGVLLTSVWQEAVDFIGDCDILTYNGNAFDVPMLYNNLIRANLTFDFKSRTFYDSLVIERKRNSMKQAEVYRRYTGKDMENTHDALHDVEALVTIFKYQNMIPEGIEDPDFKLQSPEGFVKKNDKGELIFVTGKYKGKTTNEICMTDKHYIKWVCEKFSLQTKQAIMDAWHAAHL